MAIRPFLAMTAAEIRAVSIIPPKIAWMACHFSPYATGISNRPATLPPDSLLILNDRTPICHHDPERIAQQLFQCAQLHRCSAVLLDFQRPGEPETAALVSKMLQEPPCPVCVSDLYGRDLDCPVFLPPVPHHVPLSDHLAPWVGREVWLEMALDGETVTITEEGASVIPLPCPGAKEPAHQELSLHCHYSIAVNGDAARFTLWRTPEDLENLMEEAEGLGVTTAVGLYQEWHSQK